MSDLIDRQAVIDLLKQMRKDGDMVPWEGKDVFARIRKLPTIQPEKAQLSQEGKTSDLISRQAAIDLVTDMEFMNFTAKGILRDSLRKLSPAQPELNLENLVRTIETGITATNSSDAYSLGMRNGMRWCKALLDGKEPKFEHAKQYVQPSPQWIPVSERLPEDLSEVNVTWANHNPELYYESTKDKPFTATAVYYNGEWYWYSATCVDYLEEYGRCDWDKIDEAIEIIAWMPLPEAYNPNK